jgi:hypothetical protein
MSTVVTAVVAAALLSEQDAAEILHAKKQTMRAWRNRRKGPPFYKLNGRILYKREDLQAWIEQCRIVPEQPKPGVRRSRATKRGSR